MTDIESVAGEAVVRDLGERAAFRLLDFREEQDWARVTAEAVSSQGRLCSENLFGGVAAWFGPAGSRGKFLYRNAPSSTDTSAQILSRLNSAEEAPHCRIKISAKSVPRGVISR